MKKSISQGNRSRVWGVVLFAVISAFGVTSCQTDFDLDERTPEWLGSSIYDYLKENGYTTYVRLIEDLGQKEILSKTGSKTLFVADDAAAQRFYESGVFKRADGQPVTCYEELSLSQKEMILKGSMLNNVYQVAMLSSSEGPTLGDCMRRLSSMSVYDTIPLITSSEMPNSKYFKYYKSNKSIRALKDATAKPLICFVNKFLTSKKITDDDYNFLFNIGTKFGKPGREPADASINGVRIKTQNIKCLNGFIHEMDEVIYTLPNMAEYLTLNESTRIYNSLLQRFCAPYFSQELTNRVNDLYPGMLSAGDSVFEVRYFSSRSKGNTALSRAPDNSRVTDIQLKFDPGWSSFYSSTSSTTSSDVALQQNMAVMLVPSDDALTFWWNEGAGKSLKDRYGIIKDRDVLTVDDVIEDMTGIPNNTIVKLLNNNMLNSIVGSVPSKFANVLDDANDPMGIAINDVDSVKMCCNGAVYFTNKVFSPAAYRSVSYPTLVNESLYIIHKAIEDYEFDAYLNSMVATYSFFVPVSEIHDENGVGTYRLTYIDPVSFGKTETQAFVFSLDGYDANNPKADMDGTTVTAKIYPYDLTTNSIDESSAGVAATDAQIKDRLSDLLDYHIVIGSVENNNGWEYFQSKGRGTIRFKKNENNQFVVWGGYQAETNDSIVIDNADIYDMTVHIDANGKETGVNGNGKTYIIDRPLISSKKSVYDIISDYINYPEFKEFFTLMSGTDLFQTTSNNHEIGSSRNISTFNTYHYTVYVPTNESLFELERSGQLMTPKMIDDLSDYYLTIMEASSDAGDDNYLDSMIVLSKVLNKGMTMEAAKAEAEAAKTDISLNVATDSTFQYKTYITALQNQLKNFVKYHIQDNSVYLDAEFKIDTIHSTVREASFETAYMNANQQFEKLSVRVDNASHSLIIKDQTNVSKKVVTNLGKKYYNIMCREYEYNSASNSTELETSSYAVVHLIDKPLRNGVVQLGK